MPCTDSRDPLCRTANALHHRLTDELIDRLLETEDMFEFKRAVEEERRIHEADIDAINTGKPRVR